MDWAKIIKYGKLALIIIGAVIMWNLLNVVFSSATGGQNFHSALMATGGLLLISIVALIKIKLNKLIRKNTETT